MQPGTEQTDDTPKPRRRWPGVLLSIFVPGFGLYRAGCVGHAVAWFVALLLMNLLVGFAFALESIPVLASYGVLAVNGIAFVWMLCASFQEGRMTPGKTILFAGLLAALLLLPRPGRWVAHIFKIPTGSMEPTLRGPVRDRNNALSAADHIAVSRIAYLFNPVQRGDIVAFKTRGIEGIPQDQFYIKRVVGLPGETILTPPDS